MKDAAIKMQQSHAVKQAGVSVRVNRIHVLLVGLLFVTHIRTSSNCLFILQGRQNLTQEQHKLHSKKIGEESLSLQPFAYTKTTYVAWGNGWTRVYFSLFFIH